MQRDILTGLQKRFVGLLGAPEVQALLSEITRYYVLNGWITTRAYLPEQDLSKGVLTVVVMEGRIERITGAGVTFNIFPTGLGDLLQLRALEQGINNLKRLPSNNATLELLPGTDPGDTLVVVKNVQGRRWHILTSLDNTGGRETGRNQASATLDWEDPLGLADMLSLTYRQAVPYHANSEASRSLSAYYSIPWGWELLTVGGSASSYALENLAPSGVALPFDGTSRSLYARVDRSLFRRAHSELSASGTLTWRSMKNYLLGNLIGVNSREASELAVSLDYSTAVKRGNLSCSIGCAVGLPIFGAEPDPSHLPRYAPRAEYRKGLFNARYAYPFKVYGTDFSFTTTVNAQVTSQVLYGTDQLTMGGIYAVRGFDGNNLAGDSGYVWRNELIWNLNVTSPFPRLGQRLRLAPYLGLDQGCAWTNAGALQSQAPIAGSLVGAAFGTRIYLGRLTADLSWNEPLRYPSALASGPGRFIFRASTYF